MASEIVKDEVRLLIQPTTKKGFLSVQAAVKMIVNEEKNLLCST